MQATLDYFRNLDNIHQPKWPREHKSVWFFPWNSESLEGIIFGIWVSYFEFEKLY